MLKLKHLLAVASVFLVTGAVFATPTNPRQVPLANADGGYSVYRNLDVDESPTGQSAKDAPGRLYSCEVINDTASTKEYLKIYNATAANTTVGTTTPVITVPLPAAAVKTRLDFTPYGIPFTSGITFAATTALADSDTGAPAANAVVINCLYK